MELFKDGQVDVDGDALQSLLAMTDYFLSLQPKRIPEAVQCLMASLTFNPTTRLKAQICCKLGSVLYHHTENTDEAIEYLKQAVCHKIFKSIRVYHMLCHGGLHVWC